MIDDSLIAPWERLAASRAKMAAAEGISVRTLQRRMAAARERAVDAGSDLCDLPWVELVDGRRPDRPHYDLATDRLEKPPGPFRIGDGRGRRLRVQHAGDGAKVETPKKSEHKFKPKSKRKHR